MPINIGTGRLRVVPDLQEREFRKLGNTLNTKIGGDLRILTRLATNAALGIGAIATAALAITIRGGISRLMGLEKASKQLDQMGVGLKDSKILQEELLESLLGTPFALDEGAQAVANFVSAGVELKQIPGLIDAVTDAAAFGQVPMQAVADIWQRIQLQGRATNEELQMLVFRNIPIYGILAEGIGVTESAVRDLASSGEISAEIFNDAWTKGAKGFGENKIVVEGAAKSMGDTTAGAFANMRTAASRFGTVILKDVFPLAKDVFNAMYEGFDRMGVVVKEAFADFDYSGLEEFIADIPQMMEDATVSIIDLWKNTEILREIATDTFKGIAFIITNEVVVAVGALALALKTLYAHPVIAGLAAIGFAIGSIKDHVDDIQGPIDDVKERFEELPESIKGDVFRRAINEAWGPESVAAMERFLSHSGKSISDYTDTTEGVAHLIEISGHRISDTWDEVSNQIDQQSVHSAERIRRMGEAYEGSGSSAAEFEVQAHSAAKAAEENAEEIAAAQEKMAENTLDYVDALRELSGVSTDTWTGLAGDVESFLTGFEELPEKSEVTMEEFEANFAARAARFTEFWEAIGELAGRGLHALANELIQEGPGAVDIAKQYVADPIAADTQNAFIRGAEEGALRLEGIVMGLTLPPFNIDVGWNIMTFPWHELPVIQGIVPVRGKSAPPVRWSDEKLLQHGGIVKPRRGGTPARIGEAGIAEAVIPLNRGGESFMAPIITDALKSAVSELLGASGSQAAGGSVSNITDRSSSLTLDVDFHNPTSHDPVEDARRTLSVLQTAQHQRRGTV